MIGVKSKRHIKGSKGFFITKIIVFVFFVAYSVSLIYPFIWAFLSSLKGQMEFQMNKFYLPEQWKFSNYITAWKTLGVNGGGMLAMLWNSVWLSFFSATIALVFQVFLSYTIARYRFFGRKILYYTALAALMIPIYGTLPATYRLYSDLGLYDSPLILITNTMAFGGNFIILNAIFRGLPWSYAEAAFIDGAGHFRVFFQIMIPLAIVPVSALFIMGIVGSWNDYMTPILFLPSYLTLPAGLYNYQIVYERLLNYPVLFAGILLSMLPVLLLFIAAQDKMMSLTISGGLKG